MKEFRIGSHPILDVKKRKKLNFFWNGKKMEGYEGEMLASSLFANGVRIFGHHPKDHSPQGIFCANGQCSQCMVVVNGFTAKSCMTPLEKDMRVEPLEDYPSLPADNEIPKFSPPRTIKTTVLIIGGGPAGMSAAIELGQKGIDTIIVDDRHRLGGKLVLQTHKFFGSQEACYAGERGIDIAAKLESRIKDFECVKVWTNSVAVGVYVDKKVGLLKNMEEYVLIEPDFVLISTGAREKSLVFKGNTLPGVYGAGAFQTLVNRDFIKPAKKIFIVGGGNVGLIAGYHAMQAGMEVVGLIEALKEVGGYKVHKDKLARLGVPIYTSRTIVSANGIESVESITIAEVDESFGVKKGSEKTFDCDTILIAVGLNPVDEFYKKALSYNMKVFSAGDAHEIAEASAAIYSGKIKGLEIANEVLKNNEMVPKEWQETGNILKSKPGKLHSVYIPKKTEGVFPIINCAQEIPCNPCTTVCPKNCIKLDGDTIMDVPVYANDACIGCGRCVSICPGLAITLVDYRKSSDYVEVTIPFEFKEDKIKKGHVVTAVDAEGNWLQDVEVLDVENIKSNNKTLLVKLKASKENAKSIAGIRVQQEKNTAFDGDIDNIPDDEIVCRCERVTAKEIRKLIREGVHDMNQIKILTRAGMGSCGGKTCKPIIEKMLRQEGVPKEDITVSTDRPLFVEVELEKFAKGRTKNE